MRACVASRGSHMLASAAVAVEKGEWFGTLVGHAEMSG